MEFYTEERPRIPRDTWSIRNAWHGLGLGLRMAGNPSLVPSVFHLGATRGPEMGQRKAEFLSRLTWLHNGPSLLCALQVSVCIRILELRPQGILC